MNNNSPLAQHARALMVQITQRQFLVLWLILGSIAVGSMALTRPSSYWQGEILPVSIDSFYHARRILDTVQDPSSFYEFDSRIHVPDGSLLNWPWGYDYGMAMLVRAGMGLGLSNNPVEVLVWIPVAAVFVSIGLLLLICREIGLSRWTTVLAGLCMALSPTTQLLHGVGDIDHHYAELMFILAALAFGLRWLDRPEKSGRCIAFGLVLGTAPAIHNGLFILQLPLLCALFARWLQGLAISRRGSTLVAAVLVASTIAILLPSLPFRTWRFEFYTLSWFHLYIATCTAVFLLFFGRISFTSRSAAAGAALGAALLIPILGEVRHGQEFLVGSQAYLSAISEMQPPFDLAARTGPVVLNRIYSLLIWLAPLSLLVSIAGCWFERTNRRLLFWLTCAMGLGLLFMQLRLHYFGDFALFLPWLLLAEHFAQRAPQHRKSILLGTTLALILMYAPPLRHQIAAPMPIANDTTFVPMRPMFEDLRKACAADPGVVLADNNLGHYIRYYTDCSVIANNFLLTPLHFEKMAEIERYLSMPAAELERVAPHVKYVLVRAASVKVGADGRANYGFYFKNGSRLPQDLLFDTPERVPPDFSLISEVRFPEAGNVPYAKLYKITHKTASANTATR